MTDYSHALDETDARLIALLQEDAARPVKWLSAKLGISVSSVHRRREALVRRGVIRRFTVEVDPALAGRPSLFLIEVLLERENVASVAAFKRRMRTHPAVLECFHVTGDRTFVLLVALAGSEELPKFAAWLCGDHSDTLRIRTSLVMDRTERRGLTRASEAPAGAPTAPPGRASRRA
jgi:DNA-binding Lrp family transcriptional regulator